MPSNINKSRREGNKMNQIVMVLLALGVFFFSNADASPSLKNIPEGHVLKVQFTQQRNLKDLPKPIQSNGDLTLWNGKGLLWRITEPFLTMTLITKEGIYQIEDGQKIPMAQVGQEESIFEMLSKLIHGSISEVKGFSISSLPSPHGKWRMRLSPLSTSLQGFLSFIEIEGGEYISQIIIHRANGDKDEISLKSHRVIDVKDVNHVLSVDEKRLLND